MANTIIGLNDTPSSYSLSANKFLRVNSDANAIQFWDIQLDYLEDVESSGAYAPSVGQSLVYSADGKWRPSTLDIYAAGNGMNKAGLTLNVTALPGGGLTSNASGVFITDIANVSGTYGNATHVPAITVNSKGQITSVTPTTITATQATTITNSFVGNVVGTSGQIVVTGGTGNNSNATLNLVATGVTAATYGNATTVPQITVDSYGRIQNIDQIAVSGGGSSSSNVTSAFKTITVSGQTNISSDSTEDTLTIAAGSGMSIVTNAPTDTLTISADASTIVGSVGINSLNDIDTTGVSNGQALVYNSSTSKFEVGTPTTTLANSGVTAGTYGSSTNSARITVDAKGIVTSVVEQAIPQGDVTSVVAGTGLTGGASTGDVTLSIAQTGVTAKTYGNATNYPVFTVDATGRITSVSNVAVTGGGGGGSAQSLSWNSGTYALTISGGNTVDLSVLYNNSDLVSDTTPQLGGDLDINGKDIISTSNQDIDLDPNGTGVVVLKGNANRGSGKLKLNCENNSHGIFLQGPPHSAGASYTLVFPTTAGSNDQVLTTDGSGGLSWTTKASAYGNTQVQAYLTAQGYSNTVTAYQDLTLSGNTVSLTKQFGNVDLSSIAYHNDRVASYLSSQGYATQSTIVAAITDSAPATLDTLNELAAALGDDANFSTTTSNALGNRLRIDVNNQSLTASQKANATQNLGLATVASSGLFADLGSRPIITLSNSVLQYDGTSVNLANIGAQGNTGATGATGVGVTNASVNGAGNLIITLSNASTINAGNVTGPQGAAGSNGSNGSDGISISGTSLSGSNLIINFSNSSTVDAGNIRGPQGPAGNVTTVVAGAGLTGGGSASSVTIDVTGGDGITANANDIQVDNTVVRTTGTQTIAGNKTLTGTLGVNSIGQSGGNVGITSLQQLGAGGYITLFGDQSVKIQNITYPSSDGSAGQVLTTNGAGALSFTTVNALANIVEDTTPQLGGALDVNGQDIVTTGNGDIDLDPNGSGVVVFKGNATKGAGQFKLNCENNSHGITIKGPPHSAAASYTLVLPDNDGSADQVLRTDGSGNLSWVNQTGGGGSGDITKVYITAGAGLTGTVTTDSGDHNQTLALNTSGVSAGTYGNSTTVPQIAVDTYGRITSVSNVTVSGGGGGGSQNLFDKIAVSGQSTVEADGTSDTLTLVGGSGISITTNASSDEITFTTAGGGSSATVQRFKLNYNSSGQLASTSNLTSLIDSVSIDSASGGDVTVNFDSTINYPPGSVMMYGYDYANNKYSMVPAETTMALREIAGGGSSGSPTLFNGSSSIALKLRLRETETGASRSFGTTTHAWIQFVIYE